MRTDAERSSNHMHWHDGGTCHGPPTLEECVAECVRREWTGRILEKTDVRADGVEVKCYSLIAEKFDHWGQYGVWVGEMRTTFHHTPVEVTGLSFWIVVREYRSSPERLDRMFYHPTFKVVCVCLEPDTAQRIANQAQNAWLEYKRLVDQGWEALATHWRGKLMAKDEWHSQLEHVRSLSPDREMAKFEERAHVIYSVQRASDDPSATFAVDAETPISSG